MESIQYKVDKNEERIRSEVRICSSNMTIKQAENIIESFGKIGFDTSLSHKDNQACVVIRVLDVFNSS